MERGEGHFGNVVLTRRFPIRAVRRLDLTFQREPRGARRGSRRSGNEGARHCDPPRSLAERTPPPGAAHPRSRLARRRRTDRAARRHQRMARVGSPSSLATRALRSLQRKTELPRLVSALRARSHLGAPERGACSLRSAGDAGQQDRVRSSSGLRGSRSLTPGCAR